MAINHFNAMLSIIFENTLYIVTIRDLGRLVKLHFVKNLPKISLISIIRDDICSYIVYVTQRWFRYIYITLGDIARLVKLHFVENLAKI